MSPRSKNPHGLHLLLLAALFFTFTFAGWAVNQAPPASDSDSGTIKEGNVHLDSSNKKRTTKAPVIKPMVVDAERDSKIERAVGDQMEHNHYLQKPIDADVSQSWLKNYFQALDPYHLFFLQGDIDQFTAKYGNYLGDLLHQRDSDEAMVAPAFEIFQRYLLRVKENVTLAEKLLNEKYDFTKDETFTIRNDKSPWLKDAAESEAVWRGQIKNDLLNGLLDKKPPQKTVERLKKRYNSILWEAEKDEDIDVLAQYLSALTHAYDPHSDYFDPEEAQNFAISSIDLSVTGIGAVLQSEDGYAMIENIIAGGPADLDKRLQVGDKIIAVGQGNEEPVDAVDMKLGRVVEMIRGRKGTSVHLVVLPAGQAETGVHKDIVLKRAEVSIKESLAKAHIIEHQLPGGGVEKIGVINLPEFYKNTAADVSKLVQRLKKEQVAGIILDVRNNGGGLLDQAVDLAGLFLKRDEPVVQIRQPDSYVNHISQLDTTTSQIYGGPLLVMVNKASASATEIVAGALQDYGRAVIVGDQSTHGKGTVQTLISLMPQMPLFFPSDPGPGALKITVQKFYRVAGGSTQQKGVVPDIVLPSLLDALQLGETTLPNYLPYDEVPPAIYDKLDLTSAYLPALRANSAARVAASPDFDYVRHDIDYYKNRVKNPVVSLSLATRQKEMEDVKALNLQRKKDLEARKSTRDPELDLTLDMVDQNLPAAPPPQPSTKKNKVASADDDSSGTDPDFNVSLKNLADDPQLDEAVNIMTDYNQMLHDSNSKLVQASPTPAVSTVPAAK